MPMHVLGFADGGEYRVIGTEAFALVLPGLGTRSVLRTPTGVLWV